MFTSVKMRSRLALSLSKGYPAECRILPWPIGRPSIRSCENAEGILPVSYDTGLLEKETPGFSPGSFLY
jgi:hypothetical protein